MITLDQCRILMGKMINRPISDKELATLKQVSCETLSDWLHQHMISSLAHRRLGQVWPELSRQLQAETFVVSAENSVHLTALDQVLEVFSQANIQPTILKGVALIETIYEDASLRPMVDIDLWVAADQVATGQTLLTSIGYLAGDKSDRPYALQELMQGEIEFAHPKWQQGNIDLHWSPFNGWWFRYAAKIDQSIIWQRRQLLHINKRPAWQLSTEDLLIHLIVHLSIKSAFIPHTSFRALLDIAHTIQARTINWTQFTHDVQQWHLSTTVWHVLSILNQFVTLDGVESILPTLQPSWLRRKVLYTFISPISILSGRDLTQSRWRFLLVMASTDRFSSMATYLWRIVWPEKVWLQARYGQETNWLKHILSVLKDG